MVSSDGGCGRYYCDIYRDKHVASYGSVNWRRVAQSVMLFVWGSIAFAAALLWRAYGEVTGQEAAFVLSFVFEALLYVGLICLAVGGQKAKKVLTVGK